MIRRSAYRWRPVASEEDIQASIVALLYRKADPRTMWHHPANGIPSDPITIARFKRLGMRPGVADLCITLPGGRSAYLEVKTEKGRQSEAQKTFQLHAELNGSPYHVVRSMEEADSILESWGAYRVKRELRRVAA